MCRIVMSSEVGVYRRNILRKKTKENTLLTKKKVRVKKKRKNDNDKKKENTLSAKKKRKKTRPRPKKETKISTKKKTSFKILLFSFLNSHLRC